MANILIVDDSAALREVLREVLSDAGHDVGEAGNGLVAERMCKQKGYDLVITDIFMPEKEGMATIRDLRKSHPKLKILAISGGDSVTEPDTFMNLALRYGADGILSKPFEHAVLLKEVGRLLRSPRV
ncbi:MAG: response regulator [Candidatus Hydrogenedentes bacterium]|nr:response regulator [Candidatus Hydrogenedentota bacterium]